MDSDLAQTIAYNALMGFGFGADKLTPDTNILAITQKNSLVPPLEFTEHYFYEEITFANFLVIEAELRLHYIAAMIEMFRRERGFSADVGISDVTSALAGLTYGVARDRMKLVGIEATPIESLPALETLLSARWQQYEPLLQASLDCSEEIPDDDPFTGLGVREHPHQEYLGSAADNICKAVTDGPNPPLQESLEIAVQIAWISSMNGARALNAKLA